MSLSKRYVQSTKNLSAIFQKIIEGVAPTRFTYDHLQSIGFKSSTDRAVIPLLKDLGFLQDDGAPTSRYHAYRNSAQSKAVMAEALRDAYGDLFTINEHPSEKDRAAIQGKFKSAHNTTDRVAEMLTTTFFALLRLADLSATPSQAIEAVVESTGDTGRAIIPFTPTDTPIKNGKQPLELSYTIEVHLPATTDINVYNAIFKSLKEHLLD